MTQSTGNPSHLNEFVHNVAICKNRSSKKGIWLRSHFWRIIIIPRALVLHA